MGQWIKDLAATHHTFADMLAERQSMAVPSEDPDYGDLARRFPPWPGPARNAILQPPKPEIRPPRQVLQRAADRDAETPTRRPQAARVTVSRMPTCNKIVPGGGWDIPPDDPRLATLLADVPALLKLLMR